MRILVKLEEKKYGGDMSLTQDEAKKYPAIAKIVEGLPEQKHFSATTDEMLKIIREMHQNMKESNNRWKAKRNNL